MNTLDSRVKQLNHEIDAVEATILCLKASGDKDGTIPFLRSEQWELITTLIDISEVE